MKIHYSTSAICKVNFNTSGTHAVKLTAKPSDTCCICNIYSKIAVSNFGKKNKYISTENLFKIPERAGVASIPLADLLKAHLGVEVDPQDGKSSRVCKSACDESHDSQCFKRFVCVVLPQRIVKNSRPYSLPSTSKQSKETENCRLPNFR